MRIFLTLIQLSLAICLVYSCGGGSGGDDNFSETSNVRVVINFPDGTTQKSESSELVAKGVEDLDTCKIIVSGGDPPISEINEDFGIEEPKRIGVIPGTNRNFMFIGQDIDGNPICKGETNVDIDFNTSSVFINCIFVTEICTDGMDNDFDDLIDCEDPDCDRSGCDADLIDSECIDGVCTEPEPEPTQAPEEPTNPACPEPPFESPFQNPFPGICFPSDPTPPFQTDQ